MDLTHGSVLLGDRELLADVPMYINAGALHVEILFEGVGELAQKSSDRQQSG